jgi:hypothetical protein
MYSSQVDALKLAVVAAMLDLLNLYEAAETVPGNSSLLQVLGECATALIRYFFLKNVNTMLFLLEICFFFAFCFLLVTASLMQLFWHPFGTDVLS